MQEYPVRTPHRPRSLPPGRWLMTQRWNDLLFAHWPVSERQIAPMLPEGLEVDTFQGSAWLGAVPFWLDRIKIRGIPPLSGLRRFPDLNLRTYVRDEDTGTPGLYFFSLDASSLLVVGVARSIFHLPCHWAEMRLEHWPEREFAFYSRRRFTPEPVIFKARYRSLGPSHQLAEGWAGTLPQFFSERPRLFSVNREGQTIQAALHHIPWPLEEAEAEIERNDLAGAIGIRLLNKEPVLHYSRCMAVYVWPEKVLKPAMAGRPVAVAVSPST